MTRSFSHGHPIYYDGKCWRYEDTREPVGDNRPCIRCGRMPTAEGHDPCIANLPGVVNACCGHGVEDGYVEFENGVRIRGRMTVEPDPGRNRMLFFLPMKPEPTEYWHKEQAFVFDMLTYALISAGAIPFGRHPEHAHITKELMIAHFAPYRPGDTLPDGGLVTKCEPRLLSDMATLAAMDPETWDNDVHPGRWAWCIWAEAAEGGR